MILSIHMAEIYSKKGLFLIDKKFKIKIKLNGSLLTTSDRKNLKILVCTSARQKLNVFRQ
jgi:hypothetical protein